MTLPAGWTTRRPTLDDVPAILAVVHASNIAAIGYADFSEEEIREALTAPNMDLARDSWLALGPSGEVVGWAYLDNPGSGDVEFVEVYVHPERGGVAQASLLARQLDRVAERGTEAGFAKVKVRAGAVPTEEQWIGVLRAAGFEFVNRHARMRRSLSGLSTEAPPPPPGVQIRPVEPSDDDEMRLFHRILDTAFRDTPDHQPRTYEQWREQVAALPSVAWDEWFIALVDGEPAGILQSADQSLDHNEGWVKNLAVLREHRRRGVATALLGRAFACYAAKGREYAGLGVDLSNPTEAARLYYAMGMTASYEADIFERTVEAAR